MTEFYKLTMPRFYVPHCLYHGRACDHDWKFKLDIYGYCLQYNPDNSTKPLKKISVGRQTSLSFMLGFNYTDWTSGWMSAFDGYTVFYSEPADKTLDPVYSIALSSDSGASQAWNSSMILKNSVPIVSVKQTMTKLLGEPYNSNCIDAEKHKTRLKYFDKYTKRHCHAECSYEIIAKKCGCRAAFFPRKMDERYEVKGNFIRT